MSINRSGNIDNGIRLFDTVDIINSLSVGKSSYYKRFVNISTLTYNFTCMTSHGTNLYAFEKNGVIYKSTDGAVTWATNGSDSKDWRCITFLGDVLYAGVYGGSIWKSTDYGATWTDLSVGSYNWSGMVVKGTDIYACVDYSGSGGIWKSTDGTTFSKISTQAGDAITLMDTDLYVGGGVFIKKSTDNGVTWTLINANNDCNGITSLGGLLYITIYTSILFQPTDEDVWDSIYYPGGTLNGIFTTVAGDIYLFGENTNVFKLEVVTKPTINIFSTDGTFYRNSDVIIPTEKAIKTYIDTVTSQMFRENAQIIDSDYTVAGTVNASTVGPITIASGVTVTVETGGNWVIL